MSAPSRSTPSVSPSGCHSRLPFSAPASVVASLREVSTGHPQLGRCFCALRRGRHRRPATSPPSERARMVFLFEILQSNPKRPCLPLWGRWHAPTRFPAKQKRQKRVTEEVSRVKTNRTPTVSAGVFAIGFRLCRTAIFVLGCQSILTFFFRLVKQIGWPFSSTFAILYENEREVLIWKMKSGKKSGLQENRRS